MPILGPPRGIQFLGTALSSPASATSFTLAIASITPQVVPRELMVVAVSSESTSSEASLTAPAGWNNALKDIEGDLGNGGLAIWWKDLQVADIANATFGLHSGSVAHSVQYMRFQDLGGSAWTQDGVNETDTVNAGTSQATGSASGNAARPNCVAVCAAALHFGTGTNGSATGFAGFDAGANRLKMGYKIKNTSAAENPTISWTTSRGRHGGIVIIGRS